MLEDKSFLAVIPARGGSKRVPRKNLLPLAGKPLIAWSIEAAKRSKYINQIVVTSDDEEILEIAKSYGVIAHKRASFLAQDDTPTVDALVDVLQKYTGYEYIVLLQPTSPLRDSTEINSAIEFLKQKDADGVISVCEMEHSPLWANQLPKDKSMEGFLSSTVVGKASQELPPYYRLNGAIYIAKASKFLEQRSFFLEKNIYAYEMSQRKSIDIDTQLDFDIANYLLSI